MKEDLIGLFKGKPISSMTRKELLEFATWASKRIQGLEIIEQATQEFSLNEEVLNKIKNYSK